MITPRRTRLVRVPDFTLSGTRSRGCASIPGTRHPSSSCRRAARRSSCSDARGGAATRRSSRATSCTITFTRGSPNPPRRLTALERDVIAQAAARAAAAAGGELSFQLRPGLVAEMLRFYDQLRRQSQQVKRFEELIGEALGRTTSTARPRGCGRRHAFWPRRSASTSGACATPAHATSTLLRERLMAEPAIEPVRHVVVTVADWIADPDGLYSADFDLLTRIPGLEALDIVSTERVLASGFHERLHNWWPGLEETAGVARARGRERRRADHPAGRAAGGTVVDAARSRRRAGHGRAAAEGRPPERRRRAARSHGGRVQAAAAVPVSGGGSVRRGRDPVSDVRRAAACGRADGGRDRSRARRGGVQLYARHARRAAAVAAFRLSPRRGRGDARGDQRPRPRAEPGALPRRRRTAGDIGGGVSRRRLGPRAARGRSPRRASWRRWPPRTRRPSRWRVCWRSGRRARGRSPTTIRSRRASAAHARRSSRC